METYEEGKDALITGIVEEARGKAEKVVKEARQKAKEKLKFAEQQANSIIENSEKKAYDQAAAIEKRILSVVGLESKRKSMQLKDQLLNRIIKEAREKLRQLIATDRYESILFDWIVEAAIGLGESKAYVNASSEERGKISEALLKKAAQKVEKITGKHVKLILSYAPPLHTQGVILTSPDGRIAFNNLVSTRILRKQREIQTTVWEKLLGEEEFNG